MLSLSFDNNLMTEISGNEYVVGLGYRIKDVTIKSKLAGPKKNCYRFNNVSRCIC